eukprot:6193619-Pleurochrysis_carterae.AAC.1
MGINSEDLAKLDRVPLICGIAGLFINIVLIASRYSVSWVTGVALYEGQPFPVYGSLTDVMFGAAGQFTKGIKGCPSSEYCALDILAGDCSATSATYELSGLPKTTPEVVWCQLRDAGGSALGLLWYVCALPPFRPHAQRA